MTDTMGTFVPIDVSQGFVLRQLPAAPADKAQIEFKIIAAGGGALTISTGGTDTFNIVGGSTQLNMSVLNQSVTLQYDASIGVWYSIGDGLPFAQLETVVPLLANNLSDLPNIEQAQINLGLGTAAVEAASAFDASGAAQGLLTSGQEWTGQQIFSGLLIQSGGYFAPHLTTETGSFIVANTSPGYNFSGTTAATATFSTTVTQDNVWFITNTGTATLTLAAGTSQTLSSPLVSMFPGDCGIFKRVGTTAAIVCVAIFQPGMLLSQTTTPTGSFTVAAPGSFYYSGAAAGTATFNTAPAGSIAYVTNISTATLTLAAGNATCDGPSTLGPEDGVLFINPSGTTWHSIGNYIAALGNGAQVALLNAINTWSTLQTFTNLAYSVTNETASFTPTGRGAAYNCTGTITATFGTSDSGAIWFFANTGSGIVTLAPGSNTINGPTTLNPGDSAVYQLGTAAVIKCIANYQAAGAQQLTQIITTSQSVTAPLWANVAEVNLVAGGGGGAGAGTALTSSGVTSQAGGAGGGAGASSSDVFTAAPGTAYTLTIGAGGTGGTGGAANGVTGTIGTNGGVTSIAGASVSFSALGGGKGGTSAANSTALPNGGMPAASATGDGRWLGGGGGAAQVNGGAPGGFMAGGGASGGTAGSVSGGVGGTAGTASSGGTSSSAGTAPTAAGTNGGAAAANSGGGGGGGGGGAPGGVGGNGGNGGSGYAIITWRSA